MKGMFAFIGIAVALLPLARADEKKDEGRFGATTLKGDYYVYGGTLSEMLPPTRKDRKVSFMFTGGLAKELFDQIGPDAKISCSGASDYRERNRGDLACTYTKDDGYSCYFGLNVLSGKSTHGAIC